ncbi:ADP-ribosylation, partial [Pleomassaria siparia CBS 279.74]
FDKRAVQWVYRADKRSPEQIDKAGGFWAKGYTSKSKARPDLSLFNHVGGSSDSFMSKDSDGYVSTSTSRTVTEGWIDQYLGYSGYVYKIAAYHNLIDCQGTLLEYNKHPQEKEYAAIRGIEWEQVYSYSHFTAYQDKKGKYSKQGSDHLNKYFDRKRYTGRSTGGIRYDLAGFPRKHRAWTLKPWKAY